MKVADFSLRRMSIVFTFLLGISSGFFVSAQETGTTQTSRSVIRAGTSESLELARFLGATQLNPHVVGSQLYDLRGSEGDFYVVHTRSLSPKDSGLPVPAPSSGLPGRGNPGDRFSVSHCAKNIQQDWDYSWSQISAGVWGWKAVGYSTKYVARCTAVPPPL